jgi:hypothetical protein
LKITILIVFNDFCKKSSFGGSRCPPPGGIRGKQIIYDYTTKYTGVARSDPPLKPLGNWALDYPFLNIDICFMFYCI